MQPFLEAVFVHSAKPVTGGEWRDISTADYYVFESDFGVVRLRKRLAYPMTYAHANGPLLRLGYGDESLGSEIAHTGLADVSEPTFYDDEFLYVEVNSNSQAVIVQRDAFSTLPVFVASLSDRLIMSNHYERVIQLASHEKLHPDMLVIAQYLTKQLTLGKTCFKEVEALYDRTKTLWSGGNLVVSQAPDASVSENVNRQQSDPKQFQQLLEDRLEFYWEKYARGQSAGAELSGGTDSTLINGYLAMNGYHFLPATIGFTGDFAQSQRDKLDDLQRFFGITSKIFPLDHAKDHPLVDVLRGGGIRPFLHNQDLYTHSFTKIADHLAAEGVNVVFRGVAGDELCENNPDLLQSTVEKIRKQFDNNVKDMPWLTPELKAYLEKALQKEPTRRSIPLLSPTTVTAPLGAANVYIDRNIWPVSPLADPRLYLYCQSLPIRYRTKKNIIRAYLYAREYPKSIYEPGTNEHFGFFFAESAGRYLQEPFKKLMNNSVLARMRLIDTEAAMEAWHRANQTKDPDTLFALYSLFSIEANLQQPGVASTNSGV